MTPKILVTGGSGLLGHALKEICPEAIYVASCDCDLTDICETKRLFQKVQPQKVVHLAAKVGGVKTNASNNATLYATNVQINTNVLSVAQEFGVERLISILSSCSFQFYGDRASTEDDLHKGQPYLGNLGYGMSKRMIDIQSKLLWEQFGSRFSSITPVTMFGPHDNFDPESGHVVASLIRKCFLAKQTGKPFEVWGSGRAIRQFVYSGDVAKIILNELNHFSNPETMIVAADNGMTIRDLAEMIAGLMEFKGEIIFDKTKPEGELTRVLKSKIFRTHYPDFQFTPFQEALKLTIQWFINLSGREISEKEQRMKS